MKIEQKLWSTRYQWKNLTPPVESADLVLVFGGRELLESPGHYDEIRKQYPAASILMCSTSGEIVDTRVYNERLVLTAISFEKTTLRFSKINISDVPDSYEAGRRLATVLNNPDLQFMFVISDGHLVNGSELVRGLSDVTVNIPVTGGLAGDGAQFQKTLVGLNDYPGEGNIVAVGFYGNSLKIGHGSRGGWDSFGPERLITKAENNVLYELDGKSALDLYKNYLGEKANELPGAALLFPLSIRTDDYNMSLVRTVLSIDESNKSMTFAGDMPEGSYARLMKANFDRLIDGAANAASGCVSSIDAGDAELAILISCVGRKLVLDQRVEEEVESVREILGPVTPITGFYSYGEISPLVPGTKCELHNQTMTITTLKEV